ncbi:type I-E CRISPR-associated protein Cas7/Cse4/CasC [uncultured Ruminococcus sp.]|uniref:type I-E CRISPR-associated protein Cas7/Cse4/CasC n=1 Tax=uncultured Ruminococcus sp. TaxID=165186 RepID=UPI0025E65801|nr:type I-E CRISPR-associated protein Cas7/Cse4/CasC [uncultured Ruminococcus sp.]
MSIYIDFHVLQTVPPSCVNRDDMGSPKTAIYGGAVRARVSSQSWKHAMREDFKQLFTEEELGSRTKNVVEMIGKEMIAAGCKLDDKKRNDLAVKALDLAGIKVKESKNDEPEKAEALFFMSNKQAKAIAEHALSLDLKAKESKDIFRADLKENPSVDIALFGRMAASDPTLNYDAAAQVAHAISTHAVQNEYDYFTAVDDLQEEDNSGAGHLGTVEFNSSTLYRYATVNASELVKMIGKDNAAETVRKFGQSFICSMPTGKQNTFANRTFPDTVYITIRKDQPVNLCGAFEAPVRRSDNGYAEASEKALAKYAEKVYARYAAKPVKAFCIGDSFGDDAVSLPLNELLSEIEKAVTAELDEV